MKDLKTLKLDDNETRNRIKKRGEKIKREGPENTWEKTVTKDLRKLRLVVSKVRDGIKETVEEIKRESPKEHMGKGCDKRFNKIGSSR